MKVSKTLTTLSVAAALAVGGIAVAQTSAQGENTNDLSQSSSLQATPSTDSSTTSAPDTSTLGASSGSMDSNASAEASTTTTDEPVAQVDRN